MITSNAAEILNLVGFVTGTALYAMLLAFVMRQAHREDDRRASALPFATAILGLIWNLGELSAYALPRLGYLQDSVGLWAASFPALGLLAAVVVHSVARELPRGAVVTVIAYGCSAAATVLHLQTVLTGDPDSSSGAFVLLTICYGAIIVALGVMTRGQANGQRVLWVLALALFAVSASHLGRFHGDDESWPVELIGHHAAIPLAFAILYQDYRFALADLFLKRALTLVAMVIIAFAGFSLVTAQPAGPLAAALLMALWVGSALMVPWLHRQIVRFVDTSLLGRADYAVLAADIALAVQAQDTHQGVLDAVCHRLSPALNAHRVWWTEQDPDHTADGTPVTAQAEVPTAEPPRYLICVGELTGGRRLLSGDLDLLDAVVAIAARRIDQQRLTAERHEAQLREEEMLTLAAEAELTALRAQINPHFLFNALTTIGYLIEAAPNRAVGTLLQLTALLRGVLRSDGEFTTLGRELELVEHYLKIEQERFEERLRIRIDVAAALRGCRIPSLVLQPLVENAIKHGITPSIAGGLVEVIACAEVTGGAPRLRLVVRNTGAPLLTAPARTTHDHVGLDNIQRRLMGHYGQESTFSLSADLERATVAEITLPRIDAARIHEDDRIAQIATRRTG
ncbi:MAG: hypothetical protein EXQ51_05125 [Acidobacteria bacterium]|nr:hypothetical protein [Acidobacteriota bacterium]